MFRRFAAMLAFVVMGLLAVPAFASAGTPPYQAPPVDPTAPSWAPVADSAASTTGSLASTGAGFGVGTAVAIGVAVLMVGLVLVVAGNRIRKSNSV